MINEEIDENVQQNVENDRDQNLGIYTETPFEHYLNE